MIHFGRLGKAYRSGQSRLQVRQSRRVRPKSRYDDACCRCPRVEATTTVSRLRRREFQRGEPNTLFVSALVDGGDLLYNPQTARLHIDRITSLHLIACAVERATMFCRKESWRRSSVERRRRVGPTAQLFEIRLSYTWVRASDMAEMAEAEMQEMKVTVAKRVSSFLPFLSVPCVSYSHVAFQRRRFVTDLTFAIL